MKVSNSLLTLSLLTIITHCAVCAILGEPAQISVARTPVKIDDPVRDEPIIESTKDQKQSYQTQNINKISDIIAREAYISDSQVKVDVYTLATTLFNSQKYFGDMCNRCKKLQYLAFRQGSNYLTAGFASLNFQFSASSSPLNSQLFVGQQQIDGTWAFRSLTQGKYIRASNDGSTIDWQTYVGPWERWYMERHGNHIHVQSAQFQHFYWIGGSILQQLNGGASAYVVEHWPKINWLWNW